MSFWAFGRGLIDRLLQMNPFSYFWDKMDPIEDALPSYPHYCKDVEIAGPTYEYFDLNETIVCFKEVLSGNNNINIRKYIIAMERLHKFFNSFSMVFYRPNMELAICLQILKEVSSLPNRAKLNKILYYACLSAEEGEISYVAEIQALSRTLHYLEFVLLFCQDYNPEEHIHKNLAMCVQIYNRTLAPLYDPKINETTVREILDFYNTGSLFFQMFVSYGNYMAFRQTRNEGVIVMRHIHNLITSKLDLLE